MSRLLRKRQHAEVDTDLNMVPIMNMFMVLIPFLLMSASFYHIKAINTSMPIHSAGGGDASVDKKATIKVTMIVQLKNNQIQITGNSNALAYDVLEKMSAVMDYDGTAAGLPPNLITHLQQIKDQYPASDTMVLVVDPKVTYDTIVRTMDVARKTGDRDLFTNVVISGSLG